MRRLLAIGAVLLLPGWAGCSWEDLETTYTHRLSALDARSGDVRWSVEYTEAEPILFRLDLAESTVFSEWALTGDLGIVREPDGDVVGIDLETGRRRWRTAFDGGGTAAPFVAGGVAYVRGEDGVVLALEPSSGDPLGSIATPRSDFPQLVAAAGVVIVDHGDGHSVLDADSGEHRWEATDAWSFTPLGTGAVLVRYGDHLEARSATTGAVIWTWQHAPVATDVRSGLTLASSIGELVVAGPTVGIQRLDSTSTRDAPRTSTVFLDALTGAERWSTPSGALSHFAAATVGGRPVVFEFGEPRALLARDARDGTVLWERPVRDVSAIAASADTVAVAIPEGRAVVFDAHTGSKLWTRGALHHPDVLRADARTVLVTEVFSKE
jgi:outer membrane protein assembly factor BamB